jgi:hypothetical protein
MNHTARFRLAALALVWMTALPCAAADTKPKPLAQSLSGSAKLDYESAKGLFEDRNFAAAAIKFNSAYETSHDPRLLWNVAACEKQQQHFPKVLLALRRYIELGEGVISPSEKRDAEDLVKTVEPLVSRLLVISKEVDATVTLDGEELGKTPLPGSLLIDLGAQRKLKVNKSGFKPFEQSLSVNKEETRVEVTLVPETHNGTLDIVVSPKGAIYIDGVLTGTDALRRPLSSGIHTLRIVSPGMNPYQADLAIEDDKVRTLRLTLDKEPSRGIPAWVWVVSGTALVAGAAVGGYFLFRPKQEDILPPPGTLDPGIITAGRR